MWKSRGRAMVSMFLLISLFVQATTGVSSTSSQLTHENQDTQQYGGKRTLKEGEQNAHEVHCSRKRSRAAWDAIEQYLMPFVEREKYQIPSMCRLHPDNDLFRDQEQHKVHLDVNEWRCGYCKKIFQAEKFIDQHFDNSHYDLLNVGLADSCFPVSQSPSANRLHELFLRQFCDAQTCSGRRQPFSKGGRKHTSIFYLASSILVLMLLPIFYVIVYLYQSEMREGTQDLKRIS